MVPLCVDHGGLRVRAVPAAQAGAEGAGAGGAAANDEGSAGNDGSSDDAGASDHGEGNQLRARRAAAAGDQGYQ